MSLNAAYETAEKYLINDHVVHLRECMWLQLLGSTATVGNSQKVGRAALGCVRRPLVGYSNRGAVNVAGRK